MLSLIEFAKKEDAREIAEVGIASQQSTFAPFIPRDVLLGLDVEENAVGWEKTISTFPKNTIVARDNARRIVGFCCAGFADEVSYNDGFDGRIYGIHVHPSLKSRGIGTKLLRSAFYNLLNQGVVSANVWTFCDNEPAKKFYLKSGGILVRQGPTTYRGFEIAEVAYGWSPIPVPQKV